MTTKMVPAAAGVPLNDDVMRRARRAGMGAELQNLASRAAIYQKGCLAGEDLLAALKQSNGLVNKAKELLTCSD